MTVFSALLSQEAVSWVEENCFKIDNKNLTSLTEVQPKDTVVQALPFNDLSLLERKVYLLNIYKDGNGVFRLVEYEYPSKFKFIFTRLFLNGLITAEPFEYIIRTLEFGATKYGAGNWLHASPKKFSDAFSRHVAAWSNGEKLDPESGLPHLSHAICNLLFLLALE